MSGMPDHSGISALIVAAGLSRRMGSFKPLLPLGNATVIENTVAGALAGGAECAVVVTGYRGGEVETVLYHRFGDTVRCVRNPDFAATDMLRSVQLGAAALRSCEAFSCCRATCPPSRPIRSAPCWTRGNRGDRCLCFPHKTAAAGIRRWWTQR